MITFINRFNKSFLIPFYVLVCTTLNGQIKYDFQTGYIPLESKGELPIELEKTATEKTNELLSGLIQKGNPEYKIQCQYYTDMSFEQYNCLKHGNVLFNTVINDYLDRIIDRLLIDEPELKSKIKVFPILENQANAWAYGNGQIYITLDYIARFKTEAQLAMVLCHEIAHVTNKHNYDSYVKETEIIKKVKRASMSKRDSLWKMERDIFKAHESEADLQGFYRLKKAGYSLKDIPAKFDLMLLSEYSFENTDFATNYFNGTYFKINENVFYQTIKPIGIEANYDDTWHTHPNIYKRRTAIEKEITKESGHIGKDYIVSKDTFELVSNISKFETCRINFRDFDLEELTYHSYCLLQKYPNNSYLKSFISKGLYQMALLKSYNRLHLGFYDLLQSNDNLKANANRDSTMGHISQVKKLFTRLSGEDFTLLSINYNYKLYKESNYKNTENKQLLDTLFNLLSKVHNLNYRDFNLIPAEIKTESTTNYANHLNRRVFVDAIDQKSAFLDYINEPQFKAFFKDTISRNEFGFKYIAKGRTKSADDKKKERKEKLIDEKNLITNSSEIKKINSLIILTPEFTKTVYKSYDTDTYPIEACEKAEFFKSELNTQFNKNGIKTVDIEDKAFKKQDLNNYVTISKLNCILDETDNHLDIPTSEAYNITDKKQIAQQIGSNFVLKTEIDEYIYENVKYKIEGLGTFYKDLKMIIYKFEIVNIENGLVAYHRSFEMGSNLNNSVMKDLITEDLKNIKTLQTK